jgi:hypothetical protein
MALAPVDYNPFADDNEQKQSKTSLAPVDGNPFEASWGDIGGKLVENVPQAFKRGIGGVMQAAGEAGDPFSESDRRLAEDAANPLISRVARERQDMQQSRRGALAASGERMSAEAGQALQENAPNVDKWSGKGIAYNLGVAGAQMFPGVAASIATRTPAAGAATIGAQVFGDRYAESREQGRTPEEAAQDATAYAMAEGATEMLPLGIILKGGKSLLSRVIQGTVAEGLQEGATEALQTAYDVGELGEDVTVGEALEKVGYSMVIGAGMGAGMATATHPFVKNDDPQRDKTAPLPDTRNQAAPPGDIPATMLYGEPEVDPLPPGEREQAATTPPPITPEDEASPIPTDLIAEGQKVMADTAATKKADAILGRNGLPPVNTPVSVNGAAGIVADAFASERGDGLKVLMEDGSVLVGIVDDLRARGVQIGAAPPPSAEGQDDRQQEAPRSQAPAAETTPPAPAAESVEPQPAEPLEPAGPRMTGEVPGADPQPEVAAEETPPAPADTALLDPDTIEVDAKRFQFKDGGDAEGVTEQLRGVKRWNPDYSGVAVVWEDTAGKRFIVDGHQRLGLAKRLKREGQNPAIRAVVLREADGVSADDAMFHGAMKNLAEGGESTKALDVARVFRNGGRPETIEDHIPPNRRAYQDGKALADLGDDAWGMVVNGAVPEQYAAEVGRRISDPKQQVAALGYLAKVSPRSASEARLLVGEIVSAGFAEGEQGSLFGAEAMAETLIAERAKVLDNATKNLRLMKSVFRTAVDNETLLASAGNVLDAQSNQRSMTENQRLAAVIEKLAQRKGPVSNALTEQARALKGGDVTVGEARKRFLETVRGLESFEAAADQREREGDPGFAGETRADQEVERDTATEDMFGAEAPVAPATRADRTADTIETADGPREQAVMPGAERRAKADVQAEKQRRDQDEASVRGAQSKMRRGGQQSARDQDGGLFSAERDQPDMFGTAQPAPGAPAKGENADRGRAAPAGAQDTEYGKSNKVFTEDAAAKARELLKRKLSGSQLNSGLDPEILQAGITLAGYHIEAGARKFSDYARAMVNDLGEEARPYLRSWYEGVRYYPGFDATGMTPAAEIDAAPEQETDYASGAPRGVEQDRGDAAPGDRVGAADVPAAGRSDGQGAGARVGRAEEGGQPGARRGGVSSTGAARVGERGDRGLREGGAERGRGAAERGGRGRGGDAGVDGLRTDRIRAEAVAATADDAHGLEDKRAAQEAAESIPVRPGDIDNIRETLPFLQPAQQEDVQKAEARLSQPDKHGFLFTNGTGTGKTYVGLGVIKRYAKQGRDNILIVAPSQDIVAEWIKSAKNLGLTITPLDSTTDAGKGVVVTTYANLGANRHLADREWDLVVPDESHSLMRAADGRATSALDTFRAITNHPGALNTRARYTHRDLVDKIEALSRDVEALATSDDDRQWREAETKRDKLHAMYRDLEAKVAAEAERLRSRPRSDVLFLSATPFSYVETIDYAEGYLFDYQAVDQAEAQRYNAGDGRARFFMQHFGYRMRTNRLTKPDASVNGEVLEREFHEMLKRDGALSGRALDVDADYERRFALVDDAIGNKVDEALKFLSEADDGKFRPLHDQVMEKFDYLSRMRLLEAIKAHHAVPRIKQHLALGRKVVVFHDYNEGGGFNPFDLSIAPGAKATVYRNGKQEDVNLHALYKEFLKRNPDVKGMSFSDMRAPIETLTKVFPDALVYNGKVPVKQRREAKRLFNEDGSGRDLIIIQSAAGEAGISLHDTTGQHQRVLLNLGMPVRPTTATQEEGRIYRVGQVSDAVFEYMNTGTAWERWTFAGKIAERAGTAENLAMGNRARALKQSFIDAFMDSDTFEPAPTDGKGGKERDRADNTAMSPFERAKTFYYAQQKKAGRRDQREGVDYFATPEPLGLKMVEWANVKFGEKVLEPSAGHGAIARFFPEGSVRTLVEPSENLSSRAALASPGARVVTDRFEALDVGANKFDAIVMNPPFGRGGKTAMEHVGKAARHLRNGGRIVALVPEGPTADKALERLLEQDAMKDVFMVADIKLPAVTFERAGTSVRAHVLVLEKQTDKDVVERIHSTTSDYSTAESIGEFFDRIEDASVPDRLEPATPDVDMPADGDVTIGGMEFTLTGTAAKPKKYLGRSEFGRLAKLAEQYGGAYLARSKLFTFDDAASRAAWLQAVAAGDAPRDAKSFDDGAVHGVAFDTAEAKHGKTGEDLFVASFKNRVPRETYAGVKATAEKHGGWYSAFKGRSAVPGFQFKSADARSAFLAEVGDGAVKLRATPEFDRMRPDVERAVRKAWKSMGLDPDKLILQDKVVYEGTAESVTRSGGAVTGKPISVAGMTDPLTGVAAIAMRGSDPMSTTYHEGWHSLRTGFGLTQGELTALRNDLPKLKEMARSLGLNIDINSLDQEEAEAYAFEAYQRGRAAGKGLSGAARRLFERIRRVLAKVRGALEGLGFKTVDDVATAEDVFARAARGQIRARERGMQARDRAVETALDAQQAVGSVRARLRIEDLPATPETVPHRQRTLVRAIMDGQPFEAAFRGAFQMIPVVGRVDAAGESVAGKAAMAKISRAVTEAKFEDGSALGNLVNPIIERARAGLIDRYGLSEEYKRRDLQRQDEERALLNKGMDFVKTLTEADVGLEESRVLQAMLTGERVAEGDLGKLAAPIRQAVDDMGAEAVRLGLVSPEAYQRNRGAYLHRVYAKHEMEKTETPLAGAITRMKNTARRRGIVGEALKGRGLFMDVEAAKLSDGDRAAADGALTPEVSVGRKFRVMDLMHDPEMDDLSGVEWQGERARKVKARVYLPADKPVPKRFEGHEDRGVWEVRATKKGGKVTLWRDFTKEERAQMGEILDARYTVAKTFHTMSRDLATARFYKDIAENEAWAQKDEPEGVKVSSLEATKLSTFAGVDWVKVPEAAIPNTGGKKRYGALAGMWVRAEVWRDLAELDRMHRDPGLWQAVLTQWKLNKTARSPVVHTNNVMSNLMFMDMADVRFTDLARAVRAVAKGDGYFEEAKGAGAFGSDMISQEVRQNVLGPLLDEIARQERKGDSQAAMVFTLGEMGRRMAQWAKKADNAMMNAYRMEDDVFRTALYIRRRGLGDTPEMAAAAAREQFLNYDIRAPWINAARRSVLPFISYTYRAVPVIAQSLAARPWKLAKYFTLAYMVNALGSLASGGDEEEERKGLRKEEEGWTWVGVPRMLRMPWNDEYDNPVFLDVRRWIPAGDVFDQGYNRSPLPLPTWLQPSGPIALVGEMILNRSAFTGENIYDPLVDDQGERMAKAGDYLWKAWMPSAPWVPGSWYFEKWQRAGIIPGGPEGPALDYLDRPYGKPEAILSSVGIKAKGVDVEAGIDWKEWDIEKAQRAIKTKMRSVERDYGRNRITPEEFDARMTELEEKMDRTNDKLNELFE